MPSGSSCGSLPSTSSLALGGSDTSLTLPTNSRALAISCSTAARMSGDSGLFFSASAPFSSRIACTYMRSSNAAMPMPRNVRAFGESSCARLKSARASSQCSAENSRTASSTMRRYCSSELCAVPRRGVQRHRQHSRDAHDSAIDQRSKHRAETLTKSLRRVTLHERRGGAARCRASSRTYLPTRIAGFSTGFSPL